MQRIECIETMIEFCPETFDNLASCVEHLQQIIDADDDAASMKLIVHHDSDVDEPIVLLTFDDDVSVMYIERDTINDEIQFAMRQHAMIV